jgi:hypothetical protein
MEFREKRKKKNEPGFYGGKGCGMVSFRALRGIMASQKIRKVATAQATALFSDSPSGSRKMQTDSVCISPERPSFLAFFNSVFMKQINGNAIADRIQLRMKSKPQKSWEELGASLQKAPASSRQGNSQRCKRFLAQLRQDKLFSQLKITAEYLEVPLEYFLFGEMPKLEF